MGVLTPEMECRAWTGLAEAGMRVVGGGFCEPGGGALEHGRAKGVRLFPFPLSLSSPHSFVHRPSWPKNTPPSTPTHPTKPSSRPISLSGNTTPNYLKPSSADSPLLISTGIRAPVCMRRIWGWSSAWFARYTDDKSGSRPICIAFKFTRTCFFYNMQY